MHALQTLQLGAGSWLCHHASSRYAKPPCGRVSARGLRGLRTNPSSPQVFSDFGLLFCEQRAVGLHRLEPLLHCFLPFLAKVHEDANFEVAPRAVRPIGTTTHVVVVNEQRFRVLDATGVDTTYEVHSYTFHSEVFQAVHHFRRRAS